MISLQVCVALASLIPLSYGLSCGVCIEATCPGISACTAGTMMDDCGCCAICSRAAGDKCAARYGRFGNCGDGLVCDQGIIPPGTDPFYHWLRSDGHCAPVKKSTAPVPTPVSQVSTMAEKMDNLAEPALNNDT